MPVPTDDPTAIFFYYTYHYTPLQFVAWMHMGFFIALTMMVAALAWRFPTPRFQRILVGVGLAEALGYGLRVMATQDRTIYPYIVSTLMLLTAPIALALVNYIAVGRLLAASGAGFGRLQPRHISRVFFYSDLTTFFIQMSGGGLLAMKSDAMQSVSGGCVGRSTSALGGRAGLYCKLYCTLLIALITTMCIMMRLVQIAIWQAHHSLIPLFIPL